MPRVAPILFLETPRSGGERGHRWLVPSRVPPPSDAVLCDLSQNAASESRGVGIVCVKRLVDQVVQGGLRRGVEILAVSSDHSPIPEKIAGQIETVLASFLESFDPGAVDWRNAKGLVIKTELLDDLHIIISRMMDANQGQRPVPVPPKRKVWGLPFAFLAVAVVAAALVLPGTCGDDKVIVSSDPRWEAFLKLREELADKGDELVDAKFLREVVSGKSWNEGDFLKEDLTRNGPHEVSRLLDCENPRLWFQEESFANSDEAGELRAILKAVGSVGVLEKPHFDAKFRDALNESARKLVAGERSKFKESSREFLDHQSSRIQEIPENKRLPWITPADAKRTRIVFETIKELCLEIPREYRIESWSDLFSSEIMDKIAAASQRSDDPNIGFIWSLVQPIDRWNRNRRIDQ